MAYEPPEFVMDPLPHLDLERLTMPDAPKTWKEQWGPLALKVAAFIVTWILGLIAGYFGLPAPAPIVIEVEKPVEPPPNPVAWAPTQGWIKDDAVIANNLDPDRTLQFAATPAGRAVLGDDAVFLWQAVRKAANKPAPWYPNVNQLEVGCCVGCGFKHGVDVLQAVQIAGSKSGTWKPVSVEVIYAGSRVEVGGGRISGDGSIGSWAAKWVKDWGVVPMEKHGAVDLTTFSPGRAREWGRRNAGVPDPLEPLAREHPVKGTALVTTWAECKRAIGQGYPVVVCSDQGFRMERDATGRCRPQGSWAHCMLICGYRPGADEGGFILNSWGDQAHTGPVWPADAPVAGFWADANVIGRMLSQGDSFALSDVVGFPAKPLNWFIHNDRPARVRPLDLFALTRPEVSLSW